MPPIEHALANIDATQLQDINPVSRVFVPAQLRGALLYRGSEDEAGIQCQASTIIHEDIRPVPGREDVFWVPHSLIRQDGVRCGTGDPMEYMLIVSGRDIERKSVAEKRGLGSIYAELVSNKRAMFAFMSLHTIDPLHLGFEMTAHRKCAWKDATKTGKKVSYSQGSVYMFVSSSVSKLNLGFASFRKDQVGMITILNNQNLCAYQDDFEDNQIKHPAPSTSVKTVPSIAPTQAFMSLSPPPLAKADDSTPVPSVSSKPPPGPSKQPETSAATPSSKPPVTAPSANPTASNTASPSVQPSVEPRKEPTAKKCFPNDAVVIVRSCTGSSITVREKLISDLRVGDCVVTGPNSYSRVFMFTHKDHRAASDTFVRIETASGEVLRLSSGHYINGKVASEVRIGEYLTNAAGAKTQVVSVRTVWGVGLHNPQTLDGSIIVDGIVVSTYTEAVAPETASALLAPIRSFFLLYRYRWSLLSF